MYANMHNTNMLVPAAFGRLCVETLYPWWRITSDFPAAFGRLCVETTIITCRRLGLSQPPSGGCVLKHMVCLFVGILKFQPPSGGCVLKRHYRAADL